MCHADSYNLRVEHSGKASHIIAENTADSKKTEKKLALPVTGDNTNYYESHGKIKSMIDMLTDAQREVIIANHYGELSFEKLQTLWDVSLVMHWISCVSD